MKTPRTILIVFFIVFSGLLKAQTDTLALWTFEDAAKRAAITDSASFMNTPYTADDGNTANMNVAPIKLNGSRFPTTNNWVTGSGGTGTFAPNADRWVNGSDPLTPKYWFITISTSGYENLKLSSKQRSSSTGPKDFKVQFSTDGLNWTDVPGSTITCASDFTTGVLSNLDLPAACNNQTTLYLRWIMSSNVAVNSSPVAIAGTNRIDDILITGTEGIFSNDATISPVSAIFNINNPNVIKTTIDWNDATSLVRITNSNTPADTLLITADYLLIIDTVTINTSYLASEYTSVGQQHQLFFHFNTGNPAVLTITWDNDSIYGAVINPDTADFDLTIPGNVSTSITWNDAANIVQITDNQTIPYILQSSDYVVAGNTLTIQQSYLASVLTASGQSVQLDIDFNLGSNVMFTINCIMSPPQPDVIAAWNFEDGAKRALITDNASFISDPYTADLGIPANQNISPISLSGGNTFSAWVTGSGGTGTFAPNSTAWDEGADEKYWVIAISTLNYGNLTLSSKQRSSAGGPANFMVEYSINGVNWFSVPGSTILCAENFTSGVLVDLPLPAICNSTPTLFLRWLMTSNTAVNGSDVTTTGTNRIDEIIVKGQLITNEANFIEFSFPEEAGPAFIDQGLQDITIEVLYGTDVSNLVASFILSPNATATINGVPQESGITPNNFSSIVTYLVTAGDGITTKYWNIYVNVADPNDETEIVDFAIQGWQTNMLDINSTAGTVDIEILGSSLLNLVAEFELSYGASAEIASIPQQSGVTINNFTSPVIYTVIAEDGITERDWTVNVTIFNDIPGYENRIPVSTYPNPSTGSFMLELQKNGTIQIYSNSGQLLYVADKQQGTHSISMDNVSAGIYFLKFINGETSYRIPIVIQK